MHTVFSDGQVWPTVRVLEAWRDGFDAIALTDHSGGGRNREILGKDLNLPYKLALPVAEQYGILLVHGIEVAQGLTHCNALFIKNANEVDGLDLITSLRKLKAQGAYLLWNHPGWRRPAEWYPDVDAAHREGLIQGIEIVNDTETYPGTIAWMEEKKLALFANSDVHGTQPPAGPANRRPVTLVFARTATVGGIREALDARRTAAWFRDKVWGPEELLRALWLGAVKTGGARLEFRAGNRRSGLRLENTSAIPFRLRVRRPPAWLEFAAGEIPGQRIAYAGASITKEAPAGIHRVEVDLEITSLHTGPGRNLSVPLALEVMVQQ